MHNHLLFHQPLQPRYQMHSALLSLGVGGSHNQALQVALSLVLAQQVSGQGEVADAKVGASKAVCPQAQELPQEADCRQSAAG